MLDRAAVAAKNKMWRKALDDSTVAWATFEPFATLTKQFQLTVLHNLRVQVTGTTTCLDRSSGDVHTAFLLKCTYRDARRFEQSHQLLRRYSAFVTLHSSLAVEVPTCALRPLPPKRTCALCLCTTVELQVNRSDVQDYITQKRC